MIDNHALVVIDEPALVLFLVLAVLEGVIYDDGGMLIRGLLVPKRVEMALLDEDYA